MNTQLQIDWIRTGVEIAHSEDADEIDPDCDEDLIGEALDMLNTCDDVLAFVPSIFPPTETENSYTLLHHDINPDNIIVDSENHQIVGIIDWEMTCILPRWDAFQYPKLFIDIEPLKEDEPPISVDYDDEDDYNIVLRDRWDARMLRNFFDETLIAAAKQEGIPAVTVGSKESSDFEDKKVMDEIVEDLVENWEASRFRLGRLKEKKAVTKESSGKDD